MGGDGGRSSGNAHVEFNSRADLIEALHMDGRMLNSRPLKIQLSTNDRGGYGSGGNGRRGYQDNTSNNWRSRDGIPPKNQFAPPPTAPEFEGRSGAPSSGNFGGGFRNNYSGNTGGGSGGFNRDNDNFRRREDGGSFMRRDRY